MPFRPARLLPWPLPALVAWAGAWIVFVALVRADIGALVAMVIATALGIAVAFLASTRWRRLFVAAGFPLSLFASGLAGDVPTWAWLLPLGLLLVLYPINTWGDAPVFPTPSGALRGLAKLAPLPPGASIVDAGCGLGDGLRELDAAYPDAAITGWEWSWPLRFACAARCRFATVRRVDIWNADWSGFDMVYLFQRPESMPRAAEKAARELKPGAWLASLEFPALDLKPTKTLDAVEGKRVWLYQMPFKR